ncbi:GNAT family N-acetyltransferase [Pseudoalteromonas sp. SSM20]|uniref:GNAT family N-acetyltransferase n=1 Tax=Pseudoalteromonas sp. SSM20 TaxID=3139394 RepID=UPI003BAB7B30
MLKLRRLTIDDKDALVNYLNDASVTQYLSSNIPSPYAQEDAIWFITKGSLENAMVRAIERNDKLCGVIGVYLKQAEYAHSAEIGYWLGKNFWQQGIATTAVKLFVDDIFSKTQISRIYNPVTSANIGSIRVLEKAGFVREGVLKQSVKHQGKLYDEYLYAITKSFKSEGD